MIIAQLKDLPLQIKFPSVVKLIALKDLCWIASFGQHPRHIEKEHASREKKLSMVIFFIFVAQKMYIKLDSKRSKSAHQRILS